MITMTCDVCGKVIPMSGTLRIEVSLTRANGVGVSYHFDTVACLRTKLTENAAP